MSTIVDLPNGEKATLKDSSELTNKEVKRLRRAARIASSVALKLDALGFDGDNSDTWGIMSTITDEDDETLDLFQRTAVIIRLDSWTLEQDIPQNVDEVDDLPRPIFQPLTVAAANIELSDDFEVSPDPKAPIAKSTGSRKRSAATS
jgi:hypothetical protein